MSSTLTLDAKSSDLSFTVLGNGIEMDGQEAGGSVGDQANGMIQAGKLVT